MELLASCKASLLFLDSGDEGDMLSRDISAFELSTNRVAMLMFPDMSLPLDTIASAR